MRLSANSVLMIGQRRARYSGARGLPADTGADTCGARMGVTVVELLVMLSIAAVLMAILIPAVLQARATSRTMECRSRMRQIGAAMHNFVSSHGGLPKMMHGRDGRRDRSTTEPWSPHIDLLAYLDQSALASRIASVRPLTRALFPRVASAEQRRVLTIPVPVFRCPSDDGMGLNNYVYCLGSVPVARVSETSGFWGGGAIPHIGSLPLALVKDGLSQTAVLSERISGLQNENQFDPRRDSWYSGVEQFFRPGRVTRDELIAICDSATPHPSQSYAFGGWTWGMPKYNTTAYNHCVPPNSDHTDCSTMTKPQLGRIPSQSGIFKATSHHRGGVNQLFLDGSVRLLSDAIDVGVYRALGTRDGGESLNDDAF